jgi:lactoylglutathione lyase
MVRVTDIDQSLDFYCGKLGMVETRRSQSEAGRYTLVFLAAPEDEYSAQESQAPLLELTFNWDPEQYGEGRNFGHLAFEVDNIYATCEKLQDSGVTINRPRATAAWHSYALPTTSRSRSCSAAMRSRVRNLGRAWRTPGAGDEPPI